MKTTLVLGASPNPDRYSNIAVRRLVAAGHPVIAVGHQDGRIGNEAIRAEVPEGSKVDTVTLYLNARNQEAWIDRILALRPKRIIFNPGAENPILADQASSQGIEVVEGCTLVMLAARTY
jgi:predicted CoA-binding protein